MTGESIAEAPGAGAPPRRVLRLRLAYDGTAYAGWQVQPGLETVQGTLERALRRVLDEPQACAVGAGRTDSGTHAAGQVAHVRTASRIPPASLQAGLNSLLPRDVRVLAAGEAEPGFHARFSARAKEYRYQFWHGGPAPPFLARYCLAVRGRLDLAAMAEAALLFEGTQDLSSFRDSHCTARSPVRSVHGSRLAGHGSLAVYAICARGFLQHMVRIVAGTLLAVGRGRATVADVRAIVAARDRRLAPATAPAHGLFLVRVEYPDTPGDLVARPEPVLSYFEPQS